MKQRILLIGSSDRIGLTFHFTRLAIVLKRMGNDILVLSDKRSQYDELPRELEAARITRWTSEAIDRADLTSMLCGAKDLRRVLTKEDGFDIIHAGGVKHGAKIFLATRRLSTRPRTVATVGYLPTSNITGFAFSSLNLYDRCIALSDYTRRRLEHFCVRPGKIVVIPLFAPDLDWFDAAQNRAAPLSDYGLDRVEKPVVFYAARHDPFKGIGYYLLAAATVLKSHDATFVVGGQGPITGSLKKFAERLGITKQTIFTGWISNYHLPFVLNKVTDVCISTSLVEQLPSFIMECMAARKPVIASSVAGVPEILVDGLNGYSVPLRDYRKTARRIVELLDDKDKAESMGQNGRRIVEKRLNMKTATKTLLTAYEGAMMT
jgi:glycosyltransferase involved in cell wall biosynthesis